MARDLGPRGEPGEQNINDDLKKLKIITARTRYHAAILGIVAETLNDNLGRRESDQQTGEAREKLAIELALIDLGYGDQIEQISSLADDHLKEIKAKEVKLDPDS